ncbi:ribosome-associated protein [Candidatus Magnetomoraceae bacterium gMMP-15]
MIQKFEPLIEPYVTAIMSKKAIDPVLLDVRNVTSFTDAFIICSASSSRQVTAIAEHIKQTLKKQKKKLISMEGKKEGHWVLMDYGDVIFHIFYEPIREFYDLEGLWIDGKRIELESPSEKKLAEKEDYDEEEYY